MDNKMAVSMTGNPGLQAFHERNTFHCHLKLSETCICILVSQTPNQNGMKRQGKPLPSWAQVCPVSAWENFLAWSYKSLWMDVYNGSAILTLSVVVLVLLYNISAPSIFEILIW